MVTNILIFVPNTLHLNKSGYVEGWRKEYEECEAYYVTNNTSLREDNGATKFKIKDVKGTQIDVLTSKIGSISNGGVNSPNIVRIIYDHKTFRDCDTLSSEDEYGVHFKFLSDNLKKRRRKYNANGQKNLFFKFVTCAALILDCLSMILDRIKIVWLCSATVSHFYNNFKSYSWFFNELTKERRISPKTGNFILAKLFDVVLGLVLLQFFMQNETVIVRFIEEVREAIIHNLHDLLIYLMGSPIGLKLNYAFNKSLGKFFFYHISLWRIFLVTMQPLIKNYFKLLVLPGALGFSYQIAMLSDLISIATFHVYCIYVYAARLITLQLKGLLSLWRLFIGRKYNPLRTKVDSYQYSQHQLFIGTLGFTILLFLLPTTTMYYAVFVIFRLIILTVEEISIRIRSILHCLPLYVLLLFAIKSPQVAGPLCLKWKKSKDGVPSFEARLKMLPLTTAIKTFAPDVAISTVLWNKISTGLLL